MVSPRILDRLSPLEYEHPFDCAALNTLSNTAGLDMLVRHFCKHLGDRFWAIESAGSCIRVTRAGFPDLYRMLDLACDVLALSERPILYIEQNPFINAAAVGSDRPFLRISSSAIDLLDDDMLLCLIGHELGHVKSRHVLYHTVGAYFPTIVTAVGMATLGLSQVVMIPLQAALMYWIRMSEFTADRAAYLATQDFTACARLMMVLAGLPRKYLSTTSTEEFLQQAREFQSLDLDAINRIAKLSLNLMESHPWTVLRSAELLKWHESGEYDNVVNRKTEVFDAIPNPSMNCPRCSFSVYGHERFCPSCGHQLAASPIPPPFARPR